MIEVELFDGTILEFPEGTSQEVIQRVARERTAAIRAAQQPSVQPEQPSILRDIASSVPPALARGVMELIGLPSTIADLPMQGAQALGLVPSDQDVRSPLSGGRLRESAAALTSGATERQPETTAGGYASTVAEFLPGAALGPGNVLRNMLMFGALPGAASEFAGQRTEGTPLEPYARTAAALGTSFLGVRPTGRIAPIGGADDEAVRMANILRAEGVQPTAGQIMQSGSLRRAEGMVEPSARQLEDFTAAAMRSIGSDDVRATTETLAAAQDRIVGQMDDILQGVSITPDTALANRAAQVAADYLESAPAGSVIPKVRNIVDEIINAATTPGGKQIELDTLREWRTALGRMTQSPDEATRNAAVELRQLIDGATDAALSQAGRADQLQALREARTQYRNFLAISDASTRASSKTGILRPEQLDASVIRTQGRAGYAVGRGTELANLSRAGTALLRPMATVEAGGVRRFLPEIGGAGLGGVIGFGAGNIPGAIAGTAIGAGVPFAGQTLMRSEPLQTTVLDPFAAMMQVSRTAPGLLSQ